MRTFTVAERRARLARRHHLSAEDPATDVATLARDLVGLHATDPASIFLAAWARIPGLTVADVEAALYDRQDVVRHLCMRRTLFVLPTDLIPMVQLAASNGVAKTARARLVKTIESGGVTTNGNKWLDQVADEVTAVLERQGPSTGSQISRAVPALAAKVTYAEGKAYGGPTSVTSNVLTLMAAEGRIVRGRPTGSWTSSATRWQLLPPGTWSAADIDPSMAKAELAHRWLAAFGPAPLEDLKWWTGFGLREVRAALQNLDVVDVELEGGQPGVALADDLDGTLAPEPWAAVLPALDPTLMGWQQRDWYLGAHGKVLFDSNGNGGPTLWWDGRVVGAWAQRPSGEVVTLMLEDVGRDATAAIAAVVERLDAFLGTTVVAPRFNTQLHRDLAKR